MLMLNQDNQDWYSQPQRSQRYAEKDLSLSPSARLCVLRGWTICTDVTWSDLGAYFDEVGHSADQPFAGMAGYIARAERWEQFEEEWLRILRETGLPFKDDRPYIHMREFAHSRGPFAAWKGEEEKRQRLIRDLVAVIDGTGLIPIGAVVPMAEYNKLSKTARKGFDDPYFIALQFCAKAAATSLFAFPDERVSMVFDDNREMKGRVPSLHKAIKETFMFGSRACYQLFR